MSQNANIRKIAESTSAWAALHTGLIRCGFELEFQGIDDPDVDEDNEARAPDEIIDVDGVEVGEDSSVSGGEARTIGPLTAPQFMQAARLMFGYDLHIDAGCSFHIHLSVLGVKHKYGVALQREMQAFLLHNIGMLPKSVQTRLASSAKRFCEFILDGDKFRAVHGHPQGTWEFRLFGNVTRSRDARRCLLLAVGALRHAYRVRLGLSMPLATPEFIAASQSIAVAALIDAKGLALASRAARRTAHPHYQKLLMRATAQHAARTAAEASITETPVAQAS